MWRYVRRNIDAANHLLCLQVNDRNRMAWMRVIAVNTVAVHGNVRKFVVWRDRDLMRFDAWIWAGIERRIGEFLKSDRVKEAHKSTNFVDHDEPIRAGGDVVVDVCCAIGAD